MKPRLTVVSRAQDDLESEIGFCTRRIWSNEQLAQIEKGGVRPLDWTLADQLTLEIWKEAQYDYAVNGLAAAAAERVLTVIESWEGGTILRSRKE
jgi:hypothetical protein